MSNAIVQLSYLIATVLFIFALHWMNAPGHGAQGRVCRRRRDAHRDPGDLGAAGGGAPRLDHRGDHALAFWWECRCPGFR